MQSVQPVVSIQSVCGELTEDSYLLYHILIPWLHKGLRELRISLMKLSEVANIRVYGSSNAHF